MSSAKPVPLNSPNKMKNVYYVRHGESEGNVQGIVSGGEHDALLTDEGRKQASRAGKDLKNKNIDLIVCSPMQRTLETARLIAAEVGIDSKDILVNEDFRERMMGVYSGKPHKKYREDMVSGNFHESAETPATLKERVSRGFDWLKKQQGKNVVLVSHGATGRMVKVIDQDLHHDDMYKLEGFGNTEIYEFTLE